MEFARMLDGMLSPDPQTRRKAGDYYLNEMSRMARTVMIDLTEPPLAPMVPVWTRASDHEIDTVVYSSRKSFLRQEGAPETLNDVNDVQLDRYYKNFMQGMGETEKPSWPPSADWGGIPSKEDSPCAGKPMAFISTLP